jgi:hypothetical protein
MQIRVLSAVPGAVKSTEAANLRAPPASFRFDVADEAKVEEHGHMTPTCTSLKPTSTWHITTMLPLTHAPIQTSPARL